MIESSGYLPTIRDLSREHGLAARTVQRALEALENEGLIVSEPRRGYRVLSSSHDPNRGMPLAFLLSTNVEPRKWGTFEAMLSRAFQEAAVRRGWSLLAVRTAERRVEDVIEQLRAVHACGAVLDTLDPELIRAARHLGLPVVMADAWVEQASVDAVLQDNYRGGFLAAEHLLKKGHREVHWFGPLQNTPHGRERFGGAAAALAAAGCTIGTEQIVVTKLPELDTQAAELLARPNRPRAILSLFRDSTLSLVKAARARGLVVGRDLDLVGWCAEELYEESYKALMPEGQLPAAICWSMADMGETALRRVVERRTAPDLAPLRIHVPVRLVE
jgi:LacI family transcriptional regulator